MRLIGNGLVLILPKLSQTTSGRVSFVCILQLLRRVGLFNFLIALQTNGATHGGFTDTFSNYHDYTVSCISSRRIFSLNSLFVQVDWQPDTLTWLVDGNVVRTLKKSDTINSNGVALYPTTPARIQFRYDSLLILLLRMKLTSVSLH